MSAQAPQGSDAHMASPQSETHSELELRQSLHTLDELEADGLTIPMFHLEDNFGLSPHSSLRAAQWHSQESPAGSPAMRAAPASSAAAAQALLTAAAAAPAATRVPEQVAAAASTQRISTFLELELQDEHGRCSVPLLPYLVVNHLHMGYTALIGMQVEPVLCRGRRGQPHAGSHSSP